MADSADIFKRVVQSFSTMGAKPVCVVKLKNGQSFNAVVCGFADENGVQAVHFLYNDGRYSVDLSKIDDIVGI